MRRSNGIDDETSRRRLWRSRTTAFCVAGLMAFTLVGAGTWLWGQRIGTIRAIADARAGAQRLSAQIQKAGLIVGLRSDDPAAIEVLDQLVGQDTEVLGLVLRTADGDAVYARDRAGLGAKTPLDGTALQSLRSGTPATELKLSSDPSDTILRIHQPVQAVGVHALLLQMDYDYESIMAEGRRTWRMFAPVTLGALGTMAGLWLCLAGLAVRRGRKRDAGSSTLQEHPLERQPDGWLRSELEPLPRAQTPGSPLTGRRAAREPALICAAHAGSEPPMVQPPTVQPPTVQDDGWLGTVQGGTPWPAVPFTEPVREDDVALPGALRDGGSRARPSPDAFRALSPTPIAEAVSPGFEERNGAPANGSVANGNGANGNGANGNGRSNGHGRANGARNSHGSKAGSLTHSRRRGLEAELSTMLLPLARRGIDTRLDLPPGLQLPDTTEELLIRAAEEAVRSSVSHAEANTVKVRLDVRDQRVQMTIDDDGRGFDPADLAGAHGRLGLRALTRLAADAGGALHVRSSPNRGTRLHLDLPAI